MRTGGDMGQYTHYAKALAPALRKAAIAALTEPELRVALVELFSRVLPDAHVYLTHGSEEQGKDITILRTQPFGEEVFGLVVKAGKLTGEANGPIDTVKSQAEMAYQIPAQVPGRVDRPAVTAVWILASGNMTNRARERIEAQLLNFRPTFMDTERLDELFVEYYPEIYFHGQLLAYVDETAVSLESDHLTFAASAVKLSDVFVEPFLLASDMDLPGGEYEIEQVLSEQRLRFGRIGETLQQHRRVLIVGEPGVGKSASLRKLAIDGLHDAASLALKGSSVQTVLPIPLFVRAATLVDCRGGDDLCASALPKDIPRDNFRVAEILVDGLDEVPTEFHQQVIETAVKCAEELEASLVLSSRNVDSVAEAPSGFKRFEMMPFEFTQAVEFFSKMVTNPDTLEDLKDALEQIRANLALTPLTLLLLVQLAEGADEIPATIGELYDRFTDEVLGKNDFAKGLEVAFDYQIRKRFLAALSFDEFYRKNRLEVPHDEFLEYAKAHFETYGYRVDQIGSFVAELERAEILKVGDSVQFKHRSFLEYFCALQVMIEPERVVDVHKWAVETYFDDDWSDVAFYYFGHRRLIPEAVLDGILAYDHGDEMLVRLRKFLVGRLLQAGWHTTVPLRLAGMRGALELTGAVREDFKTIAGAIHGSVPEILADVAILTLAERSFRSGILELPGRELLANLPAADAPDDEWIAYVAVLRALRRHLGSDDLLEFAARLEEALQSISNPALRGRLLLLTVWTLEDHPAAKRSLERKFKELSNKYAEAIRGILPPPRKGWRSKRRGKTRP